MKKNFIIKKVLPVIFLLLLLLLIPLFKSNYDGEYFCNYNLNNIIVETPYNCEGDFLNKYKLISGENNGVITANGGNKTECITTITSLLDKLSYFFMVKNQISDISTCELLVAEEKIENLANLIKLKLLSLDSCEITFEEYSILETKLDNLDTGYNTVISDIRSYALRHALSESERDRKKDLKELADTCVTYDRDYVVNNNLTSCSVKGNNILGLLPYDTADIPDVSDLLI